MTGLYVGSGAEERGKEESRELTNMALADDFLKFTNLDFLARSLPEIHTSGNAMEELFENDHTDSRPPSRRNSVEGGSGGGIMGDEESTEEAMQSVIPALEELILDQESGSGAIIPGREFTHHFDWLAVSDGLIRSPSISSSSTKTETKLTPDSGDVDFGSCLGGREPSMYSENTTASPPLEDISTGPPPGLARRSRSEEEEGTTPDLPEDLTEERTRVAVWASYVPPDSDNPESPALLAFRNSLSSDLTRLMRVVNAPMSRHGLLIFSNLPAAIEFLRRAKSRQLELFDMLVAREWVSGTAGFSGMLGLGGSAAPPPTPAPSDVLLDPLSGSAIGFFLVNVSSRHPVCVHTLLRLSQYDAVALGHKRTSTETLRLLLTHPEVSPVMAVPPPQAFSSFPTSRATPVSQTPSHRRARIWCALCCKESVDIPSAWRHLSKNPHEALRSLLQADLLAWLEQVYPRLARSLMLPTQHAAYDVDSEVESVACDDEGALELGAAPTPTANSSPPWASSGPPVSPIKESFKRGRVQVCAPEHKQSHSLGLFPPLPSVSSSTLPDLLNKRCLSRGNTSCRIIPRGNAIDLATTSRSSSAHSKTPSPTGTLTPPESLIFPSIHQHLPPRHKDAKSNATSSQDPLDSSNQLTNQSVSAARNFFPKQRTETNSVRTLGNNKKVFAIVKRKAESYDCSPTTLLTSPQQHQLDQTAPPRADPIEAASGVASPRGLNPHANPFFPTNFGKAWS